LTCSNGRTIIPAEQEGGSHGHFNGKSPAGVPHEAGLKERIEEAAALLGLNLTDFVLSTLSERASEVVDRHRNITLSDRDRDRLPEALNRPGQPIPALVETIKTYQERHSG
jgi:uncharacterized protein (DUF1778 family)